jgi:hypothetical protein
MATRREEGNAGHGKRPTRVNAYVFLAIVVLAVAVAVLLLMAASGITATRYRRSLRKTSSIKPIPKPSVAMMPSAMAP